MITRITLLIAFFSIQLFVRAQLTSCTNTTTAVSSITINSAVSGGNVCSSSFGSITSRGLCWSTAPSPVPGQSGTFIVQSGSGTGAFTATMTGLVPGTRYYVRSYSVPTKGYIYGNELSFITSTSSALPVVSTSLPSIVNGQISSGGNISNVGGTPVHARGICWSKSIDPTTALSTKVMLTTNASGGFPTGSFTAISSGILEENVTYYVRAFAINTTGVAYGMNQTIFNPPTTPLPILTTSSIAMIQPGSVVLGGTISYTGTSTVTQRGICWSTSPGPTVSLSTKTIDGSGTGTFRSAASNLQANTTYYFRAYAVNASGTAYGEEISYSTGGRVTDIDGNLYETIRIGTKEWMRQNLRVTKYRNGESITTQLDGASWSNYNLGAYAVYNNITDSLSVYGLLYNWYAATDPRGLCPSGWHVANETDLNELINSQPPFYQSLSTVGGVLKADSYLWVPENRGVLPRTAGFFGLPAGLRQGFGTTGAYSRKGTRAGWWYYATSNPTNFVLINESGSLIKNSFQGSPPPSRVTNLTDHREGNSVRCVKD